MNILFCLTPKDKVIFLEPRMSLRQALEKMETISFTSIPILNDDGKYIGTLCEGDILWFLKGEKTFDLKKLEKINIMELKRRRNPKPVDINTNVEDIVEHLAENTFVPVQDDRELFIGIVTRKSIINYFNSIRSN